MDTLLHFHYLWKHLRSYFEAIFLSIYLYTWDRFKNKWTHFLISIPVIIGGSFSAFFITSVNSFMNTPAGFELKNGKMVNVQPIEAMFDPSFIVRSFHVITTAGMTMAFVIASIAAFKLFVIVNLKILSTIRKL